MRDTSADMAIDADYAPNLFRVALMSVALLVIAFGAAGTAKEDPDLVEPMRWFLMFIAAPFLLGVTILGFIASVRANVLGHRLRLRPEGLEVPYRLRPGVRVIPWTDMTRLTRHRIRFNDMLHIVHPGRSTTLHRSGFRSSADYDTITSEIERRAAAARGRAI
ncbi:hypothetical protein [Thetidibacter halocola]|uniref:PH domain-containing protein n=1 Tax=Thetidibacter halocola TaxID=2827239 RepID=A0A8J7WHV9_9RHOB|nr:hypothetical protein [Thetidibacter halocola]MBS0125591.1 hypothetical protein [Thetidibacter halocola]